MVTKILIMLVVFLIVNLIVDVICKINITLLRVLIKAMCFLGIIYLLINGQENKNARFDKKDCEELMKSFINNSKSTYNSSDEIKASVKPINKSYREKRKNYFTLTK